MNTYTHIHIGREALLAAHTMSETNSPPSLLAVIYKQLIGVRSRSPQCLGTPTTKTKTTHPEGALVKHIISHFVRRLRRLLASVAMEHNMKRFAHGEVAY